MPGYNQQGLIGKEPLTGRGRGVCVGRRSLDRRRARDFADLRPRFGYGRGCGAQAALERGQGPNREVFRPTETKSAPVDLDALKAQLASTQRSIDAICHQLETLGETE